MSAPDANFIKLVEREAAKLARPSDLEALIKRLGGTSRFTGGSYVVRLRGIGGTATAGVGAAVQSWLRAAQRSIEGDQ